MKNLETKRLILRMPVSGDWPIFESWMKDKEIMKYLGGARTNKMIATTKNLIEQQWKKYSYGHYSLLLKETDELIGLAGLIKSDFEGERVDDLGALISKNHWGKGYAIEACRAVLDDSFKNHDVKRVVAWPSSHHTSSKSAAEKLGFRFVKKINYSTNEIDYKDMCLYELLRSP